MFHFLACNIHLCSKLIEVLDLLCFLFFCFLLEYLTQTKISPCPNSGSAAPRNAHLAHKWHEAQRLQWIIIRYQVRSACGRSCAAILSSSSSAESSELLTTAALRERRSSRTDRSRSVRMQACHWSVEPHPCERQRLVISVRCPMWPWKHLPLRAGSWDLAPS